MATTSDVIVLGLGPGGEAVAGDLAEAGLDVVGIESRLVGGECPYWGCVPTKMMIRASDLLAEARRIPGMAGRSTVEADWAPVAQRIREEATDTWDDRVAVERLEGKGARVVKGAGRFTGPRTIEVDGESFTARRAVVIATGTEPSIPDIPGLRDVAFWTNRDAVEADTLPASMVVIGGGAIGVELGQAFARFGTEVTILESRGRLLSHEEPEACELLGATFAREGIEVVSSCEITGVSGAFSATIADGRTFAGDALLVATGRRANLRAIAADAAGLDAGARSLAVDPFLRVADGIWAVGDVTGKGAFTHVATYQARIAVASILGRDVDAADYAALPRVTFTDPEIGAVGPTEAQARERGIDVRVATTDVARSARGWIHKAGNDGFVKLVADASRGVLVGATSAGPAGGEVLSMLALAVHARVPVGTLRTMIYAYPTFHRAVEAALAELDVTS